MEKEIQKLLFVGLLIAMACTLTFLLEREWGKNEEKKANFSLKVSNEDKM